MDTLASLSFQATGAYSVVLHVRIVDFREIIYLSAL